MRQATLFDVPAIRTVEVAAWGRNSAATEEKIKARINTFPEGQRVAVQQRNGDERVVGFCSSMRITTAQARTIKSWAQITSDGFITNHSPKGAILYGVSLSVPKGLANLNVGDLLLGEMAEIVVSNGIRYGMLGGRLPGLRRFNDGRQSEGQPPLEAGEYLMLKHHGKPRDAELRLYLNIWFMEALFVLPDYFPDPDSLNNGVLLRWHNPLFKWYFLNGGLYKLPVVGPFLTSQLGKLVKMLV